MSLTWTVGMADTMAEMRAIAGAMAGLGGFGPRRRAAGYLGANEGRDICAE